MVPHLPIAVICFSSISSSPALDTQWNLIFSPAMTTLYAATSICLLLLKTLLPSWNGCRGLEFLIIWIEFNWIAIRSADGSLSLEPWVFSVLVFGEADRPPAFQLTPSSAELAALTSITAEHRIASAMSTNYHGWGFWFSHFLFYLVDYIHMCHVLLSTSCLCLFPPTPFPVHLS